jgi:hypothetical protein
MLPGEPTPPPTGPPFHCRLEEEVRLRIPQPRPRYPPLGAAVLSHYFRGVTYSALDIGRAPCRVPIEVIQIPAAAAWKVSA